MISGTSQTHYGLQDWRLNACYWQDWLQFSLSKIQLEDLPVSSQDLMPQSLSCVSSSFLHSEAVCWLHSSQPRRWLWFETTSSVAQFSVIGFRYKTPYSVIRYHFPFFCCQNGYGAKCRFLSNMVPVVLWEVFWFLCKTAVSRSDPPLTTRGMRGS